MRRPLTLAASVLVALLAAVAVMVVAPPDTGPARAPPVSGQAAPVVAPDVPAEAPPVGPDGQPLRPMGDTRAQRLPDRPEPQPPLDDAGAWQEVRADADRRWREQSMDIAGRFADTHHLTDAERDGVLAALELMHADLAAIRADVEAGRVHPRDGRDEMEAVRGEALQTLIEEIGTQRTKALQVELNTQPGGGF